MTGELPSADLASKLLAGSGVRLWIPVVGASMRPTLRDGDRVEVDGGASAPRLGDLVLFRQADYLAVHRCLGRSRGAGNDGPWRARGDGLPRLDPPVLRERILGRIVAVERSGRVFDLSGRGARLYGMALAAHALAWSALGIVADRIGPRTFALAARADRALLAVFDRLLFPAFHRRRLEEPVGGAC